ncbi:hypothetical protein BYT27DRAFT_7078350 [Phlegmacium glaucopus]|nr:hypothetical protein BYT27DRAFT_7078350 [Phlegmacium glaucopus]
MPAIRQPLRKRCNVQLVVITCASDNTYDTRGRSHKRQKKTKRRVKPPHHSSTKGEVSISSLPLPRARSKGIYLQSYCEVVPFLSIALSDGFDPSTILPPTTSISDISFTHFIRIQYSTPLVDAGRSWSEYNLKTGTSVLNLIVPIPQEDQTQTFLSEHQLLLSRDFLSLVLPYVCGSDPPTWAGEPQSADKVHVLITAPPGPLGCIDSSSVVNIMSIVTCYFSFAGGRETTMVMECVDNEMDDLGLALADVWKGRIKGDRVEVIQRVAIAP